MTGEMYSQIVRGAIKALMQLPKEEQIKLCGDIPNLDYYLTWLAEHPNGRSEEDERAMDIIRRAAEKLEPTTK